MTLIKANYGALKGPWLPSSAGSASALIILLHGYGANGLDLFGMAEPIRQALGDQTIAIWSPDAPEPLPGADEFFAQSAYQWFPLSTLDRDDMKHHVKAVVPIVRDAILAATAALDLPMSKVVVLGFSQGGMVALETCLALNDSVAAVIGLSTGYLGGGGDAVLKSKPAVTLVHGDADPVIPPASLQMAVEDLSVAGIKAEAHLLPALQHGIDQRAFDIAISAIASGLGSTKAAGH